ncbi:CPCC family cysteine-rich protein [Tamlana sp. 2201CG12-4]|uniref:CPCC family cysteine-rich protein n=1 Tax=Tamlana sp. 2201CG12-4 TaxID=3112582 RepID=UPI002DBDFBE6|nr:CPCC family cysteine-rich protein [Tamlana sp. 2201CG12-4]MEC3906067.1 CPCC family cysteine-rich protein [Tamlana sp. 2201CG12-4]
MTEKAVFDRSKLTVEDKALLEAFQKRRSAIRNCINENNLKCTICPGCGFPTFTEDWFQDICSVCNWQHDGQDDPHADEIWGGPNHDLSLTESRLNICRLLKEKSEKLKDEINDEPFEILETLKIHNERMDSFDEEKMRHAFHDDPIWKAWNEVGKQILNDLIKR